MSGLRPSPIDHRVVVLGGGLAGLSASYHLGGVGEIHEAADVLGGLAASRQIDGYTFDYTGHLLHFKTPYVRELVSELLDEELLRHHRRAWIHLDGRRIKYPFQANLHDLPDAVRRECLDGFLAVADAPRARSRNYREWITNHFGDGIARHFMIPYNEKLWRFPLEQMSSAWIDSLIPQPDRDEVVTGASGPPAREFGYNIDFAYPRHGGIGRLAQAFEPHVGPVRYGARAARVDPVRREVVSADGRTTSYETLVSSIPLPALLRLLEPCPPEIRALAGQLKWNSIVNLNLGVDGPVDPSVHWCYFPEAEYVFYRVGVASNFSPSSAPPGKSSLYVEVSFRGECPYQRESLLARVGDDLVRCGLLHDPAQIELCDYNVLPFAYVIYDLAYGESTAAAHAYLESVGIHSIGRFGRWRYYSMEQTILDGKACAEQIRATVGAGS